MFKKPFATKNSTRLRTSDVKRLKAEVRETFLAPHAGAAAADAEAVAEMERQLLGDGKHSEVLSSKFTAHGGAQGTLYTVDGAPAFFRMLDGPLVPTVYSLWKCTRMVPCFETPGAVMPKLFNGADLMLPGVLSPPGSLGDFKPGDVMGVCVRGSKVPLVVGVALISSAEHARVGRSQGRALQTLHFAGDELWAAGDRSQPPEEAQVASEDESDDEEADDEKEADDAGRQRGDDAVEDVRAAIEQGVRIGSEADLERAEGWTVVEAESEGDVRSLSDTDDFASLDGPRAAAADTHTADDDQADAEADVDVDAASDDMNAGGSTEEHDETLKTAFLTAAVLKLKPNPRLLPMAGGAMYSAYILPCRELGASLDMKRTSYKKLSKFFKSLERQGVVKIKEHGGETRVMSINYTHPMYAADARVDAMLASFEPPRKLAGDAKPPVAPDTAPSSSGLGVAASKVTVTDLYKAPSAGAITDWVKEASKSHPLPEMMTLPDVRAALNAYAVANGLVDEKDKRMLRIDILLCNAALRKEEYATINALRRDEALDRLVARLVPHHQLTLGNGQTLVCKGAVVPVEIALRKRAGPGKLATCVTHVERYFGDLETLAHHLRVKCSASAAVAGTKEKPEIIVQGSKAFEICQVLEHVVGLPIPPGLAPVRSGARPRKCDTRLVRVTA
nr:Eukaryotic translation initiation factor 2D [Polyrhizophydium stewartii]